MFKTLKGKITLVYSCLMLMIVIVGTASVVNLFDLSKAIDGLLTENYKNIRALNTMNQALEQMNHSLLLYIGQGKEEDVDRFIEYQNLFTSRFNEEYKNMNYSNEKHCLNKIADDFDTYKSFFAQLQSLGKTEKNQALDFYNTHVLSVSSEIKHSIQDLSRLNEKAMLDSKNIATKNAKNSMYIILILSVTAVLTGFFVSKFFTERFLRPIYALTQSIKRVKAGNLGQKANFSSHHVQPPYEELRELEYEFNNMTKRLRQYEQSTLGKLTSEKNKSIAIVKSIIEPIVVLEKNLKIVLINDSFEKTFGIKEVNAINNRLFEVFKNHDLKTLMSGFVDSEEKIREKIIQIKISAQEYFFNIIITKFSDINTNVSGLIVVFQNVTALKQLERTKTDFIGTISHEFKTPLTSIMMGTSLMLDESLGKMNTRQRDVLEAIKEDGDRLTDLVNNLLELARVESGQSVFKIDSCSIAKIIEHSVKPLNKLAEQKNIRMFYEAVDNLPAVKADFERITWVVNNLITNALKYTAAGDEISVAAFVKEKKMCVSVKDTGVGIPAEFQEKIFNKFVQVKGYDLEVRGTGLGLAIVKEIVEAHGGEIWCESKLNSGSTFTFTLPLSLDKR